MGAALLLSSLAALAACTAATGPIIPTGQPGQYTLTSRSGGLTTSWVQLKSQALDRAKDYCVSQGLKMTHPDVSSNHATGLMRPETYVTFNCEPIPQPKKAEEDGKGDRAPAR
ncbi:hypothetical protein AKI39_09335 [Bordetella sp. H567]|uniref:hypothetical protein n=1 Tax=Bordetella sp. H567 TaxID=1697043 RepID=UPI00081C8D0C|nr:hypothetical protein [Bordetella sp. H567]AOB30853.1 hypothetical protein AKI39_09335 [Bordetella sp. H567]